MASIEERVRQAAARRARTQAARHMSSGAQWVGSFLGDTGRESHSSLRPEDVARSEVFYRSTGGWV